jgi:hypothetical protein
MVLNRNVGFTSALDPGEFTGTRQLFLYVNVYRRLNLYYCFVIFIYGCFHKSYGHIT